MTMHYTLLYHYPFRWGAARSLTCSYGLHMLVTFFEEACWLFGSSWVRQELPLTVFHSSYTSYKYLLHYHLCYSLKYWCSKHHHKLCPPSYLLFTENLQFWADLWNCYIMGPVNNDHHHQPPPPATAHIVVVLNWPYTVLWTHMEEVKTKVLAQNLQTTGTTLKLYISVVLYVPTRRLAISNPMFCP